MLEYDRYFAALAAEAGMLAAVVRAADPALPIPDLAADGVTDLLASIAVLSPPDSADPVFAGLCGDGETLHFHATDPGLGEAGEWQVRRTPVGVEWRSGHGKADVAVRGPARELLLVLNRRAEPEQAAGVAVFGDERLFRHWLAHSAFQ